MSRTQGKVWYYTGRLMVMHHDGESKGEEPYRIAEFPSAQSYDFKHAAPDPVTASENAKYAIAAWNACDGLNLPEGGMVDLPGMLTMFKKMLRLQASSENAVYSFWLGREKFGQTEEDRNEAHAIRVSLEERKEFMDDMENRVRKLLGD